MPTGMEYAEIQKRNQVGRLRAKLAAKKQAAETAEKGAMVSSESGVATLPPTPTAAIPEESVKAAVAAMERIQLEEERARLKAQGGATPDMLKAAKSVAGAEVLTQDGTSAMTPQEKARLNAAVGTGKSSNVRLWNNAVGQELVIDESVVSHVEGATAALVFSGCKNCKYTIKVTCAKIFVRHCEDFVLDLAEGSRVLTQMFEVERCVRTKIKVGSRICTSQVEQCSSVIVDFANRDIFGNGSMKHKDVEFGRDGMLIWAGCSDLRLRVAEDILVCDYDLEEKMDVTINRERTQFKVHYDSLGKFCSEKVTRLRNGFPSTLREELEFERRENASIQEVAQRMGISIHRKEDVIGKRVKPNELCACGSGKKNKKCCGSGKL